MDRKTFKYVKTYLFSLVYMPLRYAFRFHLFVLLTLQLEMSARVGIMDDAFDARELIEIQEFILLLVFRDQQKILREQLCLYLLYLVIIKFRLVRGTTRKMM